VQKQGRRSCIHLVPQGFGRKKAEGLWKMLNQP